MSIPSIPAPALTLSQHLPQAEGVSVHDNILQLLLELAADTQAAHCGRGEQQQSSPPTAGMSPPTSLQRDRKATLTCKLDGSAAVGLLGCVVHYQHGVIPAESIPGGTETDPDGSRVAASAQ